MAIDWAALALWAVVLLILVTVGVAAGRLAARFFLRATGTRADRR